MANVSANINTTSISVTNTPSNIIVTDTDSGSNVNVTVANNTISVGTTQTNVLVSAGSILSNAVVRNAISVTDTGGDGSLAYNSTSGIITYTGPSQAEVLAHFSNVSPINLEANGQISVDESAIFSGKTTDDLTEGSTNLYYTNARVLAYITDNGLDFNAEKVDDRVANLLQTTGNLTFTYNDGANTLTLSQSLTTDDISEGVNQYYTTAKANSAIVTYLGDSGNAPFTIAGNLDISGNLNYENVTDLYVTDQKITLNANAASDATVEIIANRPQAGTNAILRWNESTDKWEFQDNDAVYPIPKSTTDLAEGTNQYYTNAKVLTAITEGNIKFQEVAETVVTANTTITGYFGNANTGNVDQIVFETDPGLATSDSVTLLGTTNGNLNFLNGNTYQVYRTNATTYDLYTAYPGTSVQSGLGSESPSGLYVKYQAFGNITIDVDQGTLHNVEAVGNITGITFNNLQEGTSGTIILHQDSVGYRLLDTTTYGGNWSTWEFVNDFKTLTPNANSIDLINFVYDGTKIIASIENVDQLNIVTSANITSQGTITGAEISSGGDIKALGGNIFAAYLHGDGSNISGVSSLTNAQAQAYIQSNGLTMTANITSNSLISTTGNIITLANINAGGGTLTGVLTSNSNIETTSFFVGDIDGAVVQDVRNETGATLSKGKAVYLTGSATGDNPHVALADADDSAKMPALGIVYSDIANASVGQVATSGVINVASHGFTQGADLFISTTAGDLSETAPTGETGLIQKIGKVVGPNHILVQGAFRTNATPNLDENKIFIGNAANRATTVALDNLTANIKTTGNVQINPDVYKPGTPQSNQGLLGFTFDASTNRLGLGTATPEAALEIVANDDHDAQIYLTEYHDNATGTDIRFRKARNYIEAPEVLNTGDSIMQLYSTPWVLDTPDNVTSGSFSFSPLEINAFADGSHGGSDSVAVTQYQSNGADGDEFLLADRTASYSSGRGVKFSGATNANLTPLNGNVFYVTRSGGSSARVYDLYYDQERTNPVQLTGDLTDVTGLTAEFKSVYQPVGIETTQFLSNGDGSLTSTFTKLRANGTIQIGCDDTDKDGTPQMTITNAGVLDTTGNITTTANISAGNVLGIVKGEVDTISNITTTANVSGNYLLGNASQVTGVNLFETISVSGQTDVVADSISDTLTLAAGSGMTITTDAANDTITFASSGGGGSYGDSNVAAFLDSDTMTANIEYTGNLLVGAPAANANIAASNFFGNVANAPDDVDQVQFTSAPGWANGTAVTFNSTTNSNLLFLNGTTYYVQSRSADTFALYTNVGLTTPSQSGLGVESVSGLQGEYVSQGESRADIQGPVVATANVEAGKDLVAANASFADILYPYTSGGTIGFVGPRMSDVGLGGSSGDDFFWPETGRPAQGSLLIAGVNGSGYWSQGLVLENSSIDTPVASNVSSSRSTIPGGIQDIYRRSRGNTSSPTAVQLNSGSTPDIISSTKFLGHDGTNYQSSFFSNVYVDGAVSTGVVPLAMEISTWENGDSSTTNSGFGFPIVKFKSDRTIEFNSPNPLTYNNPQGNANITADGSINSNANITTVANINAAGATFTGTVTSNSNVQINSETQVDGIKGLTYDVTNNYLGLGTPIPEAPLHILSDNNGFSACVMIREFSTGTSSGDLRFQRAEGTLASPATMNNTGSADDDRIGQIRFDPIRASIPGNVSSYSFGTSPTEITGFKDGDHGLTTNLAVASYTIQSGAVGDEFLFADRTVSFNDGDGVLFNGATNANLTPLNGNVFYVDRGGNSSARTYDLYYDEALTNPVRLTGDTSDVTGLTAELRNVYQPVGLQISTIDTNSDGTLNINNHKFRADGNVEFGCTDDKADGTGNVIITPEGSITVGDRLRLKNYTSTEILALTGNTAGDVVYNSTDNLVAYYDGTNWRNIAQGAIIT